MSLSVFAIRFITKLLWPSLSTLCFLLSFLFDCRVRRQLRCFPKYCVCCGIVIVWKLTFTLFIVIFVGFAVVYSVHLLWQAYFRETFIYLFLWIFVRLPFKRGTRNGPKPCAHCMTIWSDYSKCVSQTLRKSVARSWHTETYIRCKSHANNT